MLRHLLEPDNAAIGEERHIRDAGEIRHRGAPAHIDEDARRGEHFAIDRDAVGASEARMAPDQLDIVHAAQPVLVALARIHDHLAGPRRDPGHVDADVTAREPVVGAAPRRVRRIGARHQRLGRLAPGVYAGAAHEMPLDDRDLHPRLMQPPRHRWPRLPGPDDDGVERAGRHGCTIGHGLVLVACGSICSGGALACQRHDARPPLR